MDDSDEIAPAEEARDEHGRFLPGNRFWEARSSHGRKPKFKKAADLWDACCEYFEWCDGNPLHEAKAFSYEGRVTVAPLPKMRAMTIGGLCLFLGISHETWIEWRKSRPDLSEVISRAEAIIYEQKFTGAAAGLLNPNIIARDLGLAEKNEHSGPDGAPLSGVLVVPTATSGDEWAAAAQQQQESLRKRARE